MAKTMSPKQARTDEQVCSLNRDNQTFGDYWIIGGGDNVYIACQPEGCPAESNISIPRDVFIRMVNWYQRPQKLRRSKRHD
jgi:hypothetical protein